MPYCLNASTGWGVLVRPGVLLERAEEVEVVALEPDHPPVRVWWRGHWREVVCGEGPERICGEWWGKESPLAARDYYKVQCADGEWLWLFRSVETGRWFVQGKW